MKEGTDTTGSCGEWLAIINPQADAGRAERDWPYIGKLLKESGVRYEAVFTQRKYHAVELTVEAVNSGVRNIAVVGGTTTLHEVVNGLFIQQAVPADDINLGIIPICSPEELGSIEGIPAEYPEAVAAIASGYFSLRPVATVIYHSAHFQQERRAMCSIEGGIEAAIYDKLLRMNEEGCRNALRKWFGAAKEVMKYRRPMVNIGSDGQLALSGRIARIRINAVAAEDGSLLEASVACRPRRWLSVLHAHRLCRGGTASQFNQTLTGRHIKIESAPGICICADGEVLGLSPAEVSISDKAVRVAVREKSPQSSPKPVSHL